MGKLKGIKKKIENASKSSKKDGKKKGTDHTDTSKNVSEPESPKDRSNIKSGCITDESDGNRQSLSFVIQDPPKNSPPDPNQAVVVKIVGFSLGMKEYNFGEKTSSTSLISLTQSNSRGSLLDLLRKRNSSFDAWLRGRLVACGKNRDFCKNCTISKLVDLYFKRNCEVEIENLNNNLQAQAIELAESDHNFIEGSLLGSSSDLKAVLGMSSSELLNKLNCDSFSLFELLQQREDEDFFKDIEEELLDYGIVLPHSDSTIEDPRKAAESPKKTASATSGDDLRKLQHDLKKAQQELALLKAENSQLKDEGVRLRKVAMDDTVMSTPSHQTPTSTASVRAFPPVVYIVAAIILGLIIGKFIL